jgi:predicted transcriptional regulator
VRPDAMKQTNLRLSEPLAAKLDMVSKLLDRQKQDLVAEALAPFLDDRLRELGYGEDDL